MRTNGVARLVGAVMVGMGMLTVGCGDKHEETTAAGESAKHETSHAAPSGESSTGAVGSGVGTGEGTGTGVGTTSFSSSTGGHGATTQAAKPTESHGHEPHGK